MNENRYSPLPIEDYFIECDISSVRAIYELELSEAVWNLAWLSLPLLDAIPGSGKNWHKVYQSNAKLQGAIVTDVYEDEVLYQKLCMPPRLFLSWWRREDHTIYDAFSIGGKAWVDTVTSRAEDAMMRLAGITGRKDNVIEVKFGRAA